MMTSLFWALIFSFSILLSPAENNKQEQSENINSYTTHNDPDGGSGGDDDIWSDEVGDDLD